MIATGISFDQSQTAAPEVVIVAQAQQFDRFGGGVSLVMATEQHDLQPIGLLVQLLDPGTVEVTIPNLGEIRVMRYWDTDTRNWGVRVVTDLRAGVAFAAGP